jgi:cell wall assembly regulator SMI1
MIEEILNLKCEDINWLFVLNPIGDKEIREVESKLGIRFPDDYKKCVKKYHGGSPKPNSFDFKERKGAVLNNLLNFDSNDEYDYIVEVRNMVEGMVDGIFPFAADPFGNFICFDYRDEKDSLPKVVFWDHELASIYYICDNFIELISKLYSND